MNVPNFLSIGRILLVPLTIWLLLVGEMRWALATLATAGATDALDGWIAKRFGWQTELGAYIDPLADKLLLISAFITLGAIGLLPLWLIILVVARDLLIMAAVVLSSLMGLPVPIRPHVVSKANTAAQIALVLWVVGAKAFDMPVGAVGGALVWTVAALTAASTGVYLRAWIQHMSGAAPR